MKSVMRIWCLRKAPRECRQMVKFLIQICLLAFLQFSSLFIFISLPLGLKDFFGSALQQKNFLQFAV